MRIKELILWCNGIQQHPKEYRSYKLYKTKKYVRTGKLSEVLKYVITGKRYGLNAQKLSITGGVQHKGEGGFYFGFIKDEYVEIKAWKHGFFKTSKPIKKIWRQDLNLWETSLKFGIINYYQYSVRIGGCVKTTTSLIRK